MFLVNIDESLSIMDAMINDETISHTEAKKLMSKQVKTTHKDFLLNTLNYKTEQFTFHSTTNHWEGGDEIEVSKTITGRLYKKSDVLLAIENYKTNREMKETFETLAKQAKIEKEQHKQKELERTENDLKWLITAKAEQIMKENNSMNMNEFNPFDLLMNSTMTYNEAYQQAKKEIIG
jgi:hypothetical protein